MFSYFYFDLAADSMTLEHHLFCVHFLHFPANQAYMKFVLFLFYRYCTLASFLFVFGYLFFFRTCSWFGFPTPPSHCNAIQLLVTIRVSIETFYLILQGEMENQFFINTHTDSIVSLN